MFKLFVGGFSPETSAAELKAFFGKFGKVTGFTIIYDKKSKASKGYGFLTCEAKKTQEHILALKTVEFRGRMIEINTAVDKSNDVPSDIQSKALRKLFIGGLSPATDSEALTKHFQRFGPIVTAYVILDPDTKTSRNFGYVEFGTVEAADAALAEKLQILHSRKITVERKKADEKILKNNDKAKPSDKRATKKAPIAHERAAGPKRSQSKPATPDYKKTDLSASDGHKTDSQDCSLRYDIKVLDVSGQNGRLEPPKKLSRPYQKPVYPFGESSPCSGNGCSVSRVHPTHSFYEHLVVLKKSESWANHTSDSNNLFFNLPLVDRPSISRNPGFVNALSRVQYC